MMTLFYSNLSLIKFLLSIVIMVAVLTGLILFLKWHVKAPVSRQTEVLLTGAFLGLALGAWWYVTKGDRVEDRILPPIILASPREVFLQFPELHFHQGLVRHTIVSFNRVFLGFSFAALLAVPLGLYMASFSNIAAFFRPLSLVGSYVPIVVFIPLTIAWYGIEEMQKVMFLFIGCFVVLLPLVVKTVSDVPSAYLDVAKTKGATQWQLVSKVLFPIAEADIWDHLRGVYGVGWGWIILAEVVNAENGLGYLINQSERRGSIDRLFAVVLVIIVIAVLCDQVWKYVGYWLFPYRQR